MGSALKKPAHAAEQDRPDVAEARIAWRAGQHRFDPKRLVFIDETGTSTKMTRLCGRARKGERLLAPVPHGHWKTTTFVAGLRHDRITAPLVIDCPINGHIFETYVKNCLAPNIVVMDNLSAHKVKGIRQAIEDKRAHLLYLPPYSPDLNPIEMLFSKLKALLNRAAERSIDDLWKRIGEILDTTTKLECQNFFCHAGYDQF